MLNFLKIIIVWGLLFTLFSCVTTPLPKMTKKEKSVLFVKDYIPDSQYKCMYKGIVKYTKADNPGSMGCAMHKRQAWFFIIKLQVEMQTSLSLAFLVTVMKPPGVENYLLVLARPKYLNVLRNRYLN